MTGFEEFDRATVSADRDGTDIYLLDASYTVLGAAVSDGEAPIGQELFKRFPISTEERQALCEYLWDPQGKNLLLASSVLPMLVLGSFFLQTGTFAVLIPQGKIAQILHTSAYFGPLIEQLYSNNYIAREPLGDYDLQDYEAVLRWYRDHTVPFCCVQESFVGDSVAACALCADRLARLLGCRLTCELDEMDLRAKDNFLPDFYVAVLTAAMLACQRIGQGETVKMFAQRCYGVGPVMYVRLWLRDVQDSLPELSAIERAARSRGVFFDVRPSGGLAGETDIRASLCPVDLCTVGIREVGAIPAGRCVFDLIPQESAVAYTSRFSLDGVAEMELFDGA